MLRTITSLFCLCLIVGCASRSEIPEYDVTQLRGNLRFNNVYFQTFTADPSVQGADASCMTCREAAISYLQSKDLFQEVGPAAEGQAEDSVTVEGHVLAVRIVSGAARFWGGVFAGRSYMKVNVKILDSAGSVLAERVLEGSPNAYGSAWSGGGSDRALPASMGRLVGDYVLSNAGNK